MNEEKEKQGIGKTTGKCGLEREKRPGKSQQIAVDDTTENHNFVNSNYERAESDQSVGIFAAQTKAYNKTVDRVLGNRPQHEKENLVDYTEETAENATDFAKPYGNTEDSLEFPSEGKFTPPY